MEENLSYNPEEVPAIVDPPEVNPAVVGQHEFIYAEKLNEGLKALKEDGRKVLGFKRDRAGNWAIKVMAPKVS